MVDLSTSTRRNNAGSQAEIPDVHAINDDIFLVGGYQGYTADHSKKIITYKSYANKFKIIEDYLIEFKSEGLQTLTDLGCSAGAVCIAAYFAGLEARGCDHDLEYLNVLDTASKGIVTTQKWSFGEPTPAADIVTMLALVHWVYSCTALYGSFTDMFAYLRPLINNYFIIEWVAPTDGAIMAFKHTSYNPEVAKEEYTLENFESSLHIIGDLVDIRHITDNRALYVMKKN